MKSTGEISHILRQVNGDIKELSIKQGRLCERHELALQAPHVRFIALTKIFKRKES